jgi:hypothetical protein
MLLEVDEVFCEGWLGRWRHKGNIQGLGSGQLLDVSKVTIATSLNVLRLARTQPLSFGWNF